MQGRVNAVIDPKTGVILEQTPMPPFNCLAFEGGGVACVGHAGAISVLEEYGVLDEVEYVSGVSGGALAALSVCLGMTALETEEVLKEMPMEKFLPMTESWWFTPQPLANIAELIRVWKRYGSPHAREGAEKFLAWLRELIAKKLGDPHATNMDLDARIAAEKKEFGKTRFKKLYVGAVNLSLELPKLKIFGSDSDQPIELAQMVLMSACHPCLWGAVKWDGDLWGDGGIKSIILMDMFDDDRFHPETPGRINAGVLGIKIDTQNEIDQIIWGKKIKVPIRTTSQFALQVAVATSHTIDAVKVQESRNVIALSDGGVDRYSLKLPIEKRVELIETSKVTAREYLENHMEAAYEVISYPNAERWLAEKSKSIDTLLAIKRAYQLMLDDLAESSLPEDQKNCANLKEQIAFIGEYRKRRERDKNWDGKGITYPAHVNIKPDSHAGIWHERIKYSLESRLKVLREKIQHFQREYEWLHCHYVYKINENTPEVYYGWRSEEALTILLCEDYLERLCKERDEIECKLGFVCEHHVKPDVENSKAYELFFQTMGEINKLENTSYALQAVVFDTTPFLMLTEEGESPFTFQLDVRRDVDRKLYLMAVIIYLTHRNCYELDEVKKVVAHFMPEYKAATTNFSAFIKELRLDPADVHAALFKLEALLHYFERKEYPTYQPSLNIDTMFNLPGGSFFVKPSKVLSVNAFAEAKSKDWREMLSHRLDELKLDIQRAKCEYDRVSLFLADWLQSFTPHKLSEESEPYFHGEHSEWLQVLVAYDELIKRSEVESAEIECQLRIKCSHEAVMPIESRQAYATFFAKMMELNADAGLSYAMRATIPKTLPIIDYEDDTNFPFSFRLDMRDEHDRNLYFIASFIYLEQRGCKEVYRFKEVCQLFLPDAEFSPKTRAELQDLLGGEGVALQLSMFRIECLLHCFERQQYPTYKPVMNLDDIFGLPRLVVYEKDHDSHANEKELKAVYGLSPARPLQDFVGSMSAVSDDSDEDCCAEERVITRSF